MRKGQTRKWWEPDCPQLSYLRYKTVYVDNEPCLVELKGKDYCGAEGRKKISGEHGWGYFNEVDNLCQVPAFLWSGKLSAISGGRNGVAELCVAKKGGTRGEWRGPRNQRVQLQMRILS